MTRTAFSMRYCTEDPYLADLSRLGAELDAALELVPRVLEWRAQAGSRSMKAQPGGGRAVAGLVS